MDGFGREEDMVVGRGCEGYTEEEDRPEVLLCAATLLWVGLASEKRKGAHLREGEECLWVDQATRVGCTRRSRWLLCDVRKKGGR
jgi:hypothetical protein